MLLLGPFQERQVPGVGEGPERPVSGSWSPLSSSDTGAQPSPSLLCTLLLLPLPSSVLATGPVSLASPAFSPCFLLSPQPCPAPCPGPHLGLASPWVSGAGDRSERTRGRKEREWPQGCLPGQIGPSAGLQGPFLGSPSCGGRSCPGCRRAGGGRHMRLQWFPQSGLTFAMR